MFKRTRLPSALRRRLAEAILSFARCRILIIGDLMLDTFIFGEVNRISPEAPVPVVEVREEEEKRLLGGTANVVRNVASLGARASVAGTVGNDYSGRRLGKLLQDIGVSAEGLFVEDGRPTTTKTRIIAQNQQVVRFDRECRRPVRPETIQKVLDYVHARVSEVDALIVSDYAKGMVTTEMMDGIRDLRRKTGVPVVVDPKVRQVELYRGMSMVTPNHLEASRMANVDIQDEGSLEEAGRLLLSKLECEMLLVTRGKHGMRLFLKDGTWENIPTEARRVYDVTGAGDTVLATVTLGLAAGLPAVDAARLANFAAGIVVGEVGTAAVTAAQLLDVIENGS